MADIREALEQAAEQLANIPTLNTEADGNINRALEYLGKARAALADGGWRDISTAPKDGTFILLWNEVSPGFFVGHWHLGMELWAAIPAADGHTLTFWPTHWQPLPKQPPESA